MGDMATIITGLGVILTVIVSSYFNWKNINKELRQMKQENQLTYATQLLEKRHEFYPILYQIIISFINSIRARDIQRDNLIDLYKSLTDWDQNHSIYLSAKSQFRFFQLLKTIRTVVNEGSDRPAWSERSKILENIRSTELALKSDLGVFIVEFSGAPEGFFDDYTNLFEEAKKEEQMKESDSNKKAETKPEDESDQIEEREEGTINE